MDRLQEGSAAEASEAAAVSAGSAAAFPAAEEHQEVGNVAL
jgi:hypothetical protein